MLAGPLMGMPLPLLAIGVTLALQLIIIYAPFFNIVFRTTPLRLGGLGVCALGALAVILFTESRKLFLRSRHR